ncbi:MAG: hypothetical protein [Bacteriophage sp.]|nr:MAG: hypothetical protein [Bacteriophage sp.]UWD68834.1 MAG: hypothetical protein [Bacteriophage sp.]UWD77376.1 MAG: hypothetical protein [Bacteriophage sp.]
MNRPFCILILPEHPVCVPPSVTPTSWHHKTIEFAVVHAMCSLARRSGNNNPRSKFTIARCRSLDDYRIEFTLFSSRRSIDSGEFHPFFKVYFGFAVNINIFSC